MKTEVQQWKVFYRIGGIAAFLALLTMLMEIFLTAMPDGAREVHTITELFDMYDRNWFMAMRYMGLINIIASCFLIPVYYATYGLHREKLPVISGFALLLMIISYAIFFADNTSFAFLDMARKYADANESDKILLIAAGEALFAKGASHTPGTFPGFFIGQIGGILFSIIMLKAGVLKRYVGIIGVFGFSFLLIFEIISSFIRSFYDEAMIFAMIGGISTLVWFALLGSGLLKHSKKHSGIDQTK